MKRLLVGVAVLAGVFAFSIEANAGSRGYKGEGAHPSSEYYRGGPQVKGYVKRRGGYSYTYEDAINTYGELEQRLWRLKRLQRSVSGTPDEVRSLRQWLFLQQPDRSAGWQLALYALNSSVGFPADAC